MNQQFQWTATAQPAFQGALVNLQGFALPNIPFNLPSGTTIPAYFGTDLNPNGVFDEPYRIRLVNLHIN
ncbi:MAG: hypothetical protein V3U75_12210 [Methylococcaceae bacterium]